MWFLIARGLIKIAVAALVMRFICIFAIPIFGILNSNNVQNLNDILKHSTVGFVLILIALMMIGLLSMFFHLPVSIGVLPGFSDVRRQGSHDNRNDCPLRRRCAGDARP